MSPVRLFLSPAPLDKLILHAPPFEFKTTGMRQGETLGLCWRHVDLDAGTLQDHQDRQRLDRARAAELWRDYDLVFTNEIGAPIEPASLLTTTLPAAAGLHLITFHELRHSVASLLLEHGVHTSIVADLLGHARASTTLDIYSHVAPTLAAGVATLVSDRLDAVSAQLSSKLSSNAGEAQPKRGDINPKLPVN